MAVFRLAFLLFCLSIVTNAFAQQHNAPATPTDFLDKTFHQQRRAQLRKQLPARSVAVFFANPVRNRSNDVDFHFHQDPDFYYLTGYREPNAVLLLFSEARQINNQTADEVIFVQPRNPRQELWHGIRLGEEGVKSQLGFSQVLPNTAFAGFSLPLENLDLIFFKDLPTDIRDDKNDYGDLFSLIQQFKQKTQYPENFEGARFAWYQYLKKEGNKDPADTKARLEAAMQGNAELDTDAYLRAYMAASDKKARQQALQQMPDSRLDAVFLDQVLNRMREIKTPEELKLLRKAISISAVGQIEVMKAMKPGMSEAEIQGMHEFVYKKYGSEYEGYPSIVGAGNNACVLHYITNNKPKVGNELVLMDLGAEYRGYTADVTRTIPANGKFSDPQKQLYNLVFAAQEAAFKKCAPGNSFFEPGQAAQEVVADGLVKLGIIKKPEEARQYFPHGTSHYLGLDVHDRGTFGPLKPNTVITVEPGIYIPEGSDCDKKWWGIGIRIEDDILITDKGYENLSAAAPRTVEEIEKLMAQPSPLDNFVLPDLK